MPIIRRLVLRLMALLLVTLCTRDAALRPPQPAPGPPAPFVPVTFMDVVAGPPTPADLEIMTFNLRYASSAAPHPWSSRRPVTRELLTSEHPDLIGTQEGLDTQLTDIAADLGPGYGHLGSGRDAGGGGEHSAIFYDRSRLMPVRQGDFWLSATPDVPGSIGWHASHTRVVTWALFADLSTGRHFYAVSTHLDNRSEEARQHGARLIAERLAALDPLPIVLTGDFNSPAVLTGDIYHFLTYQTGYVDTWTAAPRKGPAYATIHNYGPLTPGGERDDWILTTPDVSVLGALMNTHRDESGQFPSDHLPVQARVRLSWQGHPDGNSVPGGQGRTDPRIGKSGATDCARSCEGSPTHAGTSSASPRRRLRRGGTAGGAARVRRARHAA